MVLGPVARLRGARAGAPSRSTTAARRATRLFEGARIAAYLLVAILAIPFVVQQVRQGLHPALAQPGLVLGSGQEAVDDTETINLLGGLQKNDEAATVPAAPPAAAASAAATPQEVPPEPPQRMRAGDMAQRMDAPLKKGGSFSGSGDARVLAQSNAQVYDPTAIVQTGPGLPRWKWTTLELRWSGPVAATQRLHLYLLSPGVNLALALVRSALLLRRPLPAPAGGSAAAPPRVRGAASAALLALSVWAALGVATPRVARADIPDKAVLDDLRARLLRPPPCSPTCASSGRMAIDLHGSALRLRLEVDAAATTAVPLPGTGAQWSPEGVRVDGKPATALARVDDVLWVSLDAGTPPGRARGPDAGAGLDAALAPAQAAPRRSVGRRLDGRRRPRGRARGRRPAVHAARRPRAATPWRRRSSPERSPRS